MVNLQHSYLNIPSRLKYVATLPCEISMFKNRHILEVRMGDTDDTTIYITIPNIHDTGIAEVTILTILTILMVLRRNVMLLIKELFEVKAILSFALLTLKI